MNVRSSKSQPIKIGSLYACDTAEPHGFTAYEVYLENGQWHQIWGADGAASVSVLKCNIPLLVIDLPGGCSITNDLALYLYRGSAGGDSPWAVCLYEETLVMLPQVYFEKPLSKYIDTFYTEVNANILSISRL